MFYPELQNYLTQVSDQDVVDLFDRAVQAFDRLQFEDSLDVFENAVGDYSDAGDSAVLDALRQRLQEMLDSILLMHGVVLTTEATLSERLGVVEAICNISDGNEKDSMLLELESNQSEPEIFAACVALQSSLKMETVLALLEDVSEGLVGRLREVIEQPKAEALEDGVLVAARLAEYAKYSIVFANEPRWCDRFTHFSEAVGLSFDSYARLYMTQQLAQDLNAEPEVAWRKLCVNLIGLGCLSEEGVVKTADNAKPYLEQIVPEMMDLTRLYSKLTNLLLEFNRAQT